MKTTYKHEVAKTRTSKNTKSLIATLTIAGSMLAANPTVFADEVSDNQIVQQATDLANHVLNGDYGNGQDRIDALKAMNYDASKVQVLVNALASGESIKVSDAKAIKLDTTSTKAKKTAATKVTTAPKAATMTVDQAANKVINGDFGSGDARAAALTAQGLDANAVQAKVNSLLAAATAKAEAAYDSVSSAVSQATTQAAQQAAAPAAQTQSVSVESAIAQVAAATGTDVNTWRYIVQRESGGNWNSVNPYSSATGLFQILAGVYGRPSRAAFLASPQLQIEWAIKIYQSAGFSAWEVM
jgi:hypothetical protein